jgi:hypothetical protein
MGVIAEKPVTKAEFEERMAIAKSYGPQAVANLAAEFRRRSGPDPALLRDLQKSLAAEMALPQNFFTPHPDPIEVRHANEGQGTTISHLDVSDVSGGVTSSPITDEMIYAENPQSDANGGINKPPDLEIGGVSIPARSSMDVKLSMSPLSLSQDVKIAPVAPLSDTWKGIVWQTWVSGINELTIRLANVTDKAIKPAKQEFFQLVGVTGQPSPNASSKADGSTDLQKCGTEATPRRWTSAESYLQKQKSTAVGHLRFDVVGGNTLVMTVVGGALAKMRIPIDLSPGALHEESIAELEAQFKAIEEQIEKSPMLKELLEAGTAEIKLPDGKLGFHMHEGKAIQRPAAAAEPVAKRYTPTSAQIARDGELSINSCGL